MTRTLTRQRIVSMQPGEERTCCCCRDWCPVCALPLCRPEQDVQWAPGTLNTEYLAQYPEKRGIRGERPAREQFVPSLGRFDGRTTNRVDFTPKKAKNLGRQQHDSRMPNNVFDGRTMYQTSYDPKAAIPNQSAKKPYDDYSAPFDGTTTNRADFQDWGARPPPDLRRGDKIVTVPFDGTSTYRADYLKKERIPNDPRNRDHLLPSRNTDNYTTYGTDYVPKRFSSRANICCDDRRHPAMCSVHLSTTCSTDRRTGTGPWSTFGHSTRPRTAQ